MAAHDVVIIGYDGAELLDIAAITSVTFLANRLGADPAYRCVLATVTGGDVACDSGLHLRAEARLSEVSHADTVVVSGGLGHTRAASDLDLVRHAQRLAQGARRVGSVCTGATVLAAAGLLRGKRVTTHWRYAEQLAAAFPTVRVDPAPIFIRDGRIATSGGVTASLDLTLSFVEEDHGAELARRVALGMVTYLQRPGNQAQMSVFVTAPYPDDALVRRAIDHVVADPGADHSTSALARAIGVSPRQLHRLFVQHLGETPGAAVRRIRLESAGRLLVTTDLSMSQIAARTGFATAETLRQAFVGRYGVAPRDFRNTQKSLVDAAHAAVSG